MKAKMLWWNEFDEKQIETVDVDFVNEYGEPAENSIYILYNGKIFYCDTNNNSLVSFRLDDGFTPKKRRTQRKNNVLYRLVEPIHSETEKAYSVVVGSNGCIGKSNIKLFLEWIPKSQTKDVDKNIYVSSFIASKIPVFIDYGDSVTV